MSALPRGLVTALDAGPSRPLWLVRADQVAGLHGRWPATARPWLESTGFKAKPGATALLPGSDGSLFGALAVVGDAASPFDAARVAGSLPAGAYTLTPESAVDIDTAALGWALDRYRFRGPESDDGGARLVLPEGEATTARAVRLARAATLGRDLVNEPANRMGPAELAEQARAVAGDFGAAIDVIVGDDLLAEGYPAVHAVGRASTRAPRLIDLRWGRPDAPRLTLVGKGVCFDTGGLDIKPSSNMLLMKKDMGGAAVMLSLAQAVMDAGLPVQLRLLIPAVENSIAGNAFRPGDVLETRKGLAVEIGNTDAEGRLILCDALTEADGEAPDLLLDAATLTGAARVALGTELPALFTPDDALARAFEEAAAEARDPLWRLPLFEGYRKSLESPVADLSNTGDGRFGGAITAALYLQAFVETTTRWAHLDIYGYNGKAQPGRPRGGEATALLALYRLVERRYGK